MSADQRVKPNWLCAQAPWGRRAQPASAEAGPCLSRNQEQSEPWLDDVVESAPACSQARVRDRTNAERPKRGVETAVAIKDVIVISDETKRWKLSPFKNARSPSSRAEAMPPRLAVPCRHDENGRGVVAFDVIENSVELIEVGKDEVE